MSDVTGNTVKPSAVKHLRIPLLLVTAALSMGSGMGNPGCGGTSESRCDKGCAIDGTYVIRFADTRSLGADCATAGATLPEGEALVIRREGTSTDVNASLGDLQLTATYYGGSYTLMTLSGGRTVQGREEPASELRYSFTGAFDEAPERTDTPAVFSGTFAVSRVNVPAGAPPCEVSRNFTAKR